jgi:hypothetical protein
VGWCGCGGGKSTTTSSASQAQIIRGIKPPCQYESIRAEDLPLRRVCLVDCSVRGRDASTLQTHVIIAHRSPIIILMGERLVPDRCVVGFCSQVVPELWQAVDSKPTNLRRWACNPTFTDDSLRQQWSTLSTIPHPIWNEEPAKRNSCNRLHISWSIVYMNSPVMLENNTHQQEQPGQTCLLVTPQRR